MPRWVSSIPARLTAAAVALGCTASSRAEPMVDINSAVAAAGQQTTGGHRPAERPSRLACRRSAQRRHPHRAASAGTGREAGAAAGILALHAVDAEGGAYRPDREFLQRQRPAGPESRAPSERRNLSGNAGADGRGRYAGGPAQLHRCRRRLHRHRRKAVGPQPRGLRRPYAEARPDLRRHRRHRRPVVRIRQGADGAEGGADRGNLLFGGFGMRKESELRQQPEAGGPDPLQLCLRQRRDVPCLERDGDRNGRRSGQLPDRLPVGNADAARRDRAYPGDGR